MHSMPRQVTGHELATSEAMSMSLITQRGAYARAGDVIQVPLARSPRERMALQ